MPALTHGHGNARERPNKGNIVLEEMANYGDKVGVCWTWRALLA